MEELLSKQICRASRSGIRYSSTATMASGGFQKTRRPKRVPVFFYLKPQLKACIRVFVRE